MQFGIEPNSKPEAPNQAELPTAGRLSQTTSNSVKCPKCKARFPNKTQLASHVLGTHGRKAFVELKFDDSRQWRQRQGGSKAGVVPTAKEMDQADQGPTRDAKRYWGHSFRDHGQFGSYPSHDDMDDESSA